MRFAKQPSHGQDVIIETNAGAGIGCSNDDYIATGAQIIDTDAEICATAEMIAKVKEPLKVEYEQLCRRAAIIYLFA